MTKALKNSSFFNLKSLKEQLKKFKKIDFE
jgi:hypothetical protein